MMESRPAPANKAGVARIALLAAWLLIWALMVSVAVQDYARDEGRAYWQPVLWESSSILTVTALLLLQYRFTRAHDHLIAQPARWFALQACWLPLYWIAFVPIAFGIRHGVYALAGQVYEHEGWGETFLYEALKLTVFLILFHLVRFGILSYNQLLQEKLRVEKANALLRQAQLQRLAQQMQPHFLFNALNTVSSLMHSDVDKADAVLVQLADVLRATLAVSDVHAAPLSTELRLVQGYARVMQERYADRVTLSWHISDAALACQVPVMSVQPLLENIFKHTVERRRACTAIAIAAEVEHGMLTVSLQDDGGTLGPRAGGGIGLANLRERLAVLFGERASVTLTQLAPCGVRTEMKLPCAS